MPELLEAVEVKLQWDDLRAVEYPIHDHGLSGSDTKRLPGTHVSGIIKVVAKDLGILKEREADPESHADDIPLVIFLGMAFETMAARLYPEMDWQPGPVVKDGIVGSPDGYSRRPYQRSLVVDEFKYTYKSSRHRHENICAERMWMMQGMSYCHMQEEFTDLLNLHVCWALGEYGKFPYQPRYCRYLIRFSERELKNNWSLMKKYKSKAEVEL